MVPQPSGDEGKEEIVWNMKMRNMIRLNDNKLGPRANKLIDFGNKLTHFVRAYDRL